MTGVRSGAGHGLARLQQPAGHAGVRLEADGAGRLIGLETDFGTARLAQGEKGVGLELGRKLELSVGAADQAEIKVHLVVRIAAGEVHFLRVAGQKNADPGRRLALRVDDPPRGGDSRPQAKVGRRLALANAEGLAEPDK